MKTILPFLIFGVFLGCNYRDKSIDGFEMKSNQLIRVKLCVEDHAITEEWRKALVTRQSKKYLDSLSGVKRILSEDEMDWYRLIESRTYHWVQLRDSLMVPFGNLRVADTIRIFLGYQGTDDGFTYEYQTICFDLTALQKAYGSANDSINTNRVDRLFAHEYTHLLSKEWAKQNKLILRNFEDSVLWECMYEGLGMYRSMSSKWFPDGKVLSATSSQTFESLYPVFTERLIAVYASSQLSEDDKAGIQKNLSRGSMTQKWGALPVGVWLALEAEGDDNNLVKWVNQGHHALMPLAMKYLPDDLKLKLKTAFENNR